MDFETFYNGAEIHYMGSDDVEYVARVKKHEGLQTRSCIVTRADNSPIVVSGTNYPAGYVVGHGEFTARNMHNEAIQYQVAA